MGIINVTPNAFYSQSRIKNKKHLLQISEKMLNEGADFLDIGGYSSHPEAKHINEDEEIKRVIDSIQQISQTFPNAILSIDTFRSKVAKLAVEAGASMINDISGGHLDQHMLKTVSDLQVPYIAMHMRGNPQTMKQFTSYNDLIQEIITYFSFIISKCKLLGINDLIIDPGFGFSKNIEQNFVLLKNLEHFKLLERPILVGISRKSMIYKTLNCSPENALNGTTVLNTLALIKGINILRVHDVRETKEIIKLIKHIL